MPAHHGPLVITTNDIIASITNIHFSHSKFQDLTCIRNPDSITQRAIRERARRHAWKCWAKSCDSVFKLNKRIDKVAMTRLVTDLMCSFTRYEYREKQEFVEWYFYGFCLSQLDRLVACMTEVDDEDPWMTYIVRTTKEDIPRALDNWEYYLRERVMKRQGVQLDKSADEDIAPGTNINIKEFIRPLLLVEGISTEKFMCMSRTQVRLHAQQQAAKCFDLARKAYRTTGFANMVYLQKCLPELARTFDRALQVMESKHLHPEQAKRFRELFAWGQDLWVCLSDLIQALDSHNRSVFMYGDLNEIQVLMQEWRKWIGLGKAERRYIAGGVRE